MLSYMAGVSLSDRVASSEVASRCGVKPLLQVLRESRLRWFGHVRRRRGAGELEEVMEMEVTGTRHRGRPNKVSMRIIEKDLSELNLTQDDAHDKDTWSSCHKRRK